jgi:hypothetical protein
MRINELIVEQQLDELSLAGALGSAAKGAANVVGGTRGALAGARDVFNQRADRVANVAQRRVQQAAGYKAPPTAPATTAAPPASTGTQPVTQPASTAATPAPTGTAPAATTPPAAAPAATGTPANTTQSNPTASGNIGVPAGRQAVDNAIATIKAVRSDRRPQVVAYGIQQLGTVKESNVGIKSNFLGIEI